MIKKKKIRIPAASNGQQTDGDQNKTGVNGFLGSIPQIIDLAGQAISAGTGNGNVLSNALGMAGTGASIGSTFGPLGAGIGAAAGATIGTLARGLSGGRDAEMTSFTDFDEGELAGFLRPGKRREQRRLRRHYAEQAYANKAAVEGTGQLQANYNLEYGNMGTNTFANGGITNSLAYVDDGELISTPDGQISKVPELGRPTDSNLVSLPEGSRILSDKLKVPGTKKTFAQLGEEMMTTKKSKFNDKYAENAAKLNEMNNKSIHDQLFEIQEMVKAKKGIKRKYKEAVVAAAYGDEPDNYVEQLVETKPTDPPYTLYGSWGVGNTVAPIPPTEQPIAQPIKPKGRISPQVKQWSYGDNFKYLQNGEYNQNYLNFINNVLTQDMIDRALTEYPETFSRFRGSNPNYRPLLSDVRKWATDYKPSDFHRFAEYLYDNQVRLSKPTGEPMPDLMMAGLNVPTAPGQPSRSALATSIELGNYPTPNVQPRRTKKPEERPNLSNILSNALTSLAGLTPIISNLTEKPEYQDPNYNPYSIAIQTTMRNRRYNISPAIRDVERNRAIANYDASQMNTNTGSDLAFRLQNASNTNRAIADIRAQESNVNNAYLGEYANMLNNLGQQWAAETTRVDDANMANRAQARNIRRAGLSGLSQWAQNRELMRNQRERDNAMMALYEPFLQAGFTPEDLTRFRNFLRRGGNR